MWFWLGHILEFIYLAIILASSTSTYYKYKNIKIWNQSACHLSTFILKVCMSRYVKAFDIQDRGFVCIIKACNQYIVHLSHVNSIKESWVLFPLWYSKTMSLKTPLWSLSLTDSIGLRECDAYSEGGGMYSFQVWSQSWMHVDCLGLCF